ncbi:hypothetical protein OH76DRAFT_605557 [Lentinus brumalis]|uniref:SnoaL-like domain-containing protein n=1 Tax=Lentinus brumalis TaxID=2498619 RepID=A0A371DUM0_9APHY|nr:hypothetical protein OH76DRAFT_605557 [Polyporus brumalis]
MASTAHPSSPSPLYARLHYLAQSHALPRDVDELLTIRHPSATHAWGHNHLVRNNAGLQDRMDNAAFAAHLASSGRYLTSPTENAKVHEITVDEHKRTAVVHMSYYLMAKGSSDDEVVENDLIWLLRFTEEAEQEVGGVDGVRIKESVEFIDASASARLGTLVRAANGGQEVGGDVRGGITLKE